MTIIEEVRELKNIQHQYELQLHELKYIQSASSSDELSEQSHAIEICLKNIINLDKKIDNLYLKLGSDKLFEEIMLAIEVGGKEEMLKVVKRQLSFCKNKRRLDNEDK
jgi:hypothetical protein